MERGGGSTEKPHKRLEVWKLGMELCRDIYDLSARLPDAERYGLSAQMKRAAVSVPSNIAEGAARTTGKEFMHFLSIAQGSLSELDTQLELCSKYLRFLEPVQVAQAFENIDRVSRMITGLKKSLASRT
ncbi:MAG: four helix bundle protein [Deferrisomatales bacterium]